MVLTLKLLQLLESVLLRLLIYLKVELFCLLYNEGLLGYKKMKLFSVFICVVCLTCQFCHGGDLRVDSILATVNGTPISLLDVILESSKKEARLSAVYKGKELDNAVKELRKKVVEQIVDRKLIYADYLNYQFKIPPQYIENTLQDLSRVISDGTITGLTRKAEEYGTSIDDLRQKAIEKVSVDLMVLEFCFRKVGITPKQVYMHYKNNLDKFGQDNSILLQVIMLSKVGKHKDDLPKIISEIKKSMKNGNKSIFKTMVKMYSEGPGADGDGSLGWVEESKLRPEFAKAVIESAVGSVQGPVDTEEGVYFLRIADRKSANRIPFKKVSVKIKDQLEHIQKEKNYKEYLEKLKKNAVVRFFF